jgi:hypothetical protein
MGRLYLPQENACDNKSERDPVCWGRIPDFRGKGGSCSHFSSYKYLFEPKTEIDPAGTAILKRAFAFFLPWSSLAKNAAVSKVDRHPMIVKVDG